MVARRNLPRFPMSPSLHPSPLPPPPPSQPLQPLPPNHPKQPKHPTPNPSFSNNTHKPIYFSKWNRKETMAALESGQLLSIYCKNLPYSWTTSDILSTLSAYGEIVDIYIPSKKSKNRKRFGFIRFKRGFRQEDMLEAISKIPVGNGFRRAIGPGRSFLTRMMLSSTNDPSSITIGLFTENRSLKLPEAQLRPRSRTPRKDALDRLVSSSNHLTKL
ncbi:hypothetical protein Tsubulata_032670 [Turnera subulata]|uniref:RRM domain-containing protein n=1 Tax=Turnera subulata TaxID=218843 RepID=A0A9Q0J5V2_9ROSI|nr:hypothetical protein Tsubulata_032670 [Turnera subulata]